MKKHLISLEDMTPEKTPVVSTEPLAVKPAPIVAPDEDELMSIEVLDNAEDEVIEDLGETIDEASQVVDTLDSISSSLEKNIEENKPMDTAGAEVLDIAIEHILNRIQVKNVKLIPSMENFGGKTSKLEGTKLAMENISEFAKKVWEKIKLAFKKLWNWLKDFFKKAMGANTTLDKAIKDLLEKNKNAKDDPKAEKIEFAKARQAEYMVLGKEVTRALNNLDGLKKQTADMKIIISSVIKGEASKDKVQEIAQLFIDKEEEKEYDFTPKTLDEKMKSKLTTISDDKIEPMKVSDFKTELNAVLKSTDKITPVEKALQEVEKVSDALTEDKNIEQYEQAKIIQKGMRGLLSEVYDLIKATLRAKRVVYLYAATSAKSFA